MGYERFTIEMSGVISRHNSPKDMRDKGLVYELEHEIATLIAQPKYEPLRLDVIRSGVAEEDAWAKAERVISQYMDVEPIDARLCVTRLVEAGVLPSIPEDDEAGK